MPNTRASLGCGGGRGSRTETTIRGGTASPRGGAGTLRCNGAHSRVPARQSDAGDSRTFRRHGCECCFAERRCCRSQKEAELLFSELQTFAATFVPIPPNQEEADECMEDASGGRVTAHRIAMKSCGFSDSTKFNSGGATAHGAMSPARLCEGPHRTLFASAHNALHGFCIISESLRVLEHRMQNLFPVLQGDSSCLLCQ